MLRPVAKTRVSPFAHLCMRTRSCSLSPSRFGYSRKYQHRANLAEEHATYLHRGIPISVFAGRSPLRRPGELLNERRVLFGIAVVFNVRNIVRVHDLKMLTCEALENLFPRRGERNLTFDSRAAAASCCLSSAAVISWPWPSSPSMSISCGSTKVSSFCSICLKSSSSSSFNGSRYAFTKGALAGSLAARERLAGIVDSNGA